jgi:heat shock protein HslJ
MQRILLVLLAGLSVAGCAAGSSSIQHTRSTDPRTILGKTWQWESTITPVEKITVPAPERYTIFLQADGRAQMRFDCNRGGGEYKISESKLSFGPLLSTRMACPPDSLDSAFIRDLQRVVSFFVDNGRLYLELPYDSGMMKFRPEGTP